MNAVGQLGHLYEQTQQWTYALSLTQQALILAQEIRATDIAATWLWQLGRIHKAQGNVTGAIAAYDSAVNTLQSLRQDLVAVNPDVQFSFREPGKFWVYEQVMKIPFYGIYEVNNSKLEVYHLIEGVYQKMTPNERGHYPIARMQVELGLWRGIYLNQPEQLWLRWWDLEGNLLLTGKEEAQQQQQRAEQAEQRAEQEQNKREQLTQKLRSLSPEQLNT